MILTGCRAGLLGNHFASACKQRADPPGLCQGCKGEDSFGVCGRMYVGVCETIKVILSFPYVFATVQAPNFSQESQPVPFLSDVS